MPRIGILGLTENTPAIVWKLQRAGFTVFYVWSKSHEPNINGVLCSKNPFAVIAESDLLVIAREDEGSYGLITESLFAMKPILLDNLPAFTGEEIHSISKLSSEAAVPVIPLIDEKILALVNSIHQLFPETIRFIHGVIKGKIPFFKPNDWPFQLMLFLTLLFKSNIHRTHAEIFSITAPLSPSYFHFSFLSGSAAFYCEPSSDENILTLDMIGKKNIHLEVKNQMLLVSPAGEQKIVEPDTKNFVSRLVEQLLTNECPSYPLSLYDLKQLIHNFLQIKGVGEKTKSLF